MHIYWALTLGLVLLWVICVHRLSESSQGHPVTWRKQVLVQGLLSYEENCLAKKSPLCNSHFTHAYLLFSLGKWDQSLFVYCMSVSLSLCIFVSPPPFLFLWQCCPIYPRLVSNSRAQVNASVTGSLGTWLFFRFNRHIITTHVYKAQHGVLIHICCAMINYSDHYRKDQSTKSKQRPVLAAFLVAMPNTS